MAAQDGLTFEGTFNNSTTGEFKNNTTRDITPSKLRLLPTAIKESFLNRIDDAYTGSFPQVTASGTNTYAATPSPAITAYATGQKFQIKFTNASSGVSTLNLNTVGAKKIFINPTTQATTGHIVAGQISLLAYDAALDSAAGGFLMLGSATDTSGFATTAYVDGLVLGLLDDRGNFDASVNAYPSSGGSGTAGAILKGDVWRISVAGTLPTGVVVQVGDAVRALVNTPGNTQANWAILEGNVPDADATTKGIAKLYTTPNGTNTDGAVSQAGLNAKFRLSRVVTGTDSLVQTDDNALIVFNSATPFNFTVDQLTVGSKFGWVNYGAGTVTLVGGTGVTIDGNTAAAGKSGNIIASGLVDFSLSATVPKSVSGEPGGGGDREAVAIATGTLNLNINSQREKNFDLTTTLAGAVTITFSNTGSWVRSRLTLRVDAAARAVTLPSACIMDSFEVANGRFVTATNILTLTGTAANSPFMLEFVPDSVGNVWVFATNDGV